jgi:galactose-6-phosphate isomerase
MAGPQLDVNIVLSSPMFMDTFIVVRRVSGVNAQGRMEVTETQIPTTGVVQPSGANTQERPKGYATGRKSCLVITQFRLRAQSDSYAPDLVLWRGDDYLVETIEDYTNYGRGFVQAYCTSQDLQDAPPMEGTGSVN